MTIEYVVYGPNGFWGKNSQWVSSLSDAKIFSRDDAVQFARRRHNPNLEGPVPALPVPLDDAKAVNE